MTSPHGSRLRQAVRWLAIRFLSDRIRKIIKATLQKFSDFHLLVGGASSHVAQIRTELERLKDRQVLAEGKLNLAIYGIPETNEYREYLLSTSVLFKVPKVDWVADPNLPHLLPSVADVLKEAAAKDSRILSVGFYFGELVSAVPGIKLTAAGFCGGKPAEGLEVIGTDPVTALSAFPGRQWGAIVCSAKFCVMTPLEQREFIRLGIKALAPGGMFVLQLPNLSCRKVAEDLYWRDPTVFRPYSVQWIGEQLGEVEIKYDAHGPEGSHEVILQFRNREAAS